MNSPRILLLTLLFAVAAQIYAQQTYQTVVRTDIKGRLLTVDEGCGYSKVANTRIVGGGPAKDGAWPWMALLGTKVGWSFSFKCGGTLITSKHVLTAAHCTEIANQPLTFARLGEYNTFGFTKGKEDIDIAQTFKHEGWSMAALANDIAVLKLVRDVTFTERIVPICLPDNGAILTKSFVGQNPFVAGWGRTEEGKTQKPTILQQVQLPVISNAECKQKYVTLGQTVAHFNELVNSKFDKVPEMVICAGFAQGGKDTCQGDSGGPIMLPEFKNGKFPYYQIGVNSYGYGCGRANVPGVYTSVRTYMPWINSKLSL